MNKFEKLIGYVINEDHAKAKALFHKIVIDASRNIYESLEEAECSPIQRGRGAQSFGNEIEDQQNEIEGDMHEAEGDEFGDDDMGAGGDEFGDDDMGAGGDDFGGEAMGAGDEFGDEELGGEEDLEDRVMNLEDAIDELKAEFDELMAGEDAEEENFPGIHGDEDGAEDEAEFGSDEMDSEDGEDAGNELDDETEVEGSKFGEASIYGESKKSPSELMREYVEKVGQDWGKNFPAEGDPIGSGGTKSPINKKSINISGKNDVGGTVKNIAQSDTASDKDTNTGPKKPSNAYSKGEKKMGQDKYENSPGANTKGYKDKRSAKTKEGSESGAGGTVPVAKKSFEPGGTPGFKG